MPRVNRERFYQYLESRAGPNRCFYAVSFTITGDEKDEKGVPKQLVTYHMGYSNDLKQAMGFWKEKANNVEVVFTVTGIKDPVRLYRFSKAVNTPLAILKRLGPIKLDTYLKLFADKLQSFRFTEPLTLHIWKQTEELEKLLLEYNVPAYFKKIDLKKLPVIPVPKPPKAPKAPKGTKAPPKASSSSAEAAAAPPKK